MVGTMLAVTAAVMAGMSLLAFAVRLVHRIIQPTCRYKVFLAAWVAASAGISAFLTAYRLRSSWLAIAWDVQTLMASAGLLLLIVWRTSYRLVLPSLVCVHCPLRTHDQLRSEVFATIRRLERSLHVLRQSIRADEKESRADAAG